MTTKKQNTISVQEYDPYDQDALKTLTALDKIYNKNVSSDDLVKELAKNKGEASQDIIQLGILTKYYEATLTKASQSFWVATIFTSFGLLSFIGAVIFLSILDLSSAAVLSVIVGGIMEFVSVVIYIIYGRTASQFSDFHFRLSKLQMVFEADNMCSKIGDATLKDKTRSFMARDIIRTSLQNEHKNNLTKRTPKLRLPSKKSYNSNSLDISQEEELPS